MSAERRALTSQCVCVSDQAAEALGEAGISTGAMRWQTTQDKESDILAQTVMAGERMPGTAACNRLPWSRPWWEFRFELCEFPINDLPYQPITAARLTALSSPPTPAISPSETDAITSSLSSPDGQ